ncbi:hypothetical protein A7W90_16145 [Clostridium sp. Bc-iso-3]|nr:hypothetical protein A7W90_16145 [Clostridium sp. Bc-iso-3]
MITPEEEKEFLELKERFEKALKYEEEKYMTDTPEGKAWAEKAFLEIVKRITILWDKMTGEQREDLWVKR